MTSSALLTVRATVLAATLVVTGCAGSQPDTSTANQCVESENLLAAVNFIPDEGQRNPWRPTQHSSRPSFTYGVDAGVLTITQEGREPWFILRQTVADPRLAGRTLKFSAMTRGDVVVDPPIHGFEHLAGLYYAPRAGRRVLSTSNADHIPNQGVWDWRDTSVTIDMPENATSVQVGFIHKAGGTLAVKAPSLTIIDCPSS